MALLGGKAENLSPTPPNSMGLDVGGGQRTLKNESDSIRCSKSEWCTNGAVCLHPTSARVRKGPGGCVDSE